MSVAGRLVLVAGATSTSGHAACRVLAEAGARVIGVGRDADKLGALKDVRTEVCRRHDPRRRRGHLHPTGCGTQRVRTHS